MSFVCEICTFGKTGEWEEQFRDLRSCFRSREILNTSCSTALAFLETPLALSSPLSAAVRAEPSSGFGVVSLPRIARQNTKFLLLGGGQKQSEDGKWLHGHMSIFYIERVRT